MAFQDALERRIRWWIGAVDHMMVRLLKSFFRFDMKPIGKAKHYMGSLTIPMALDLHKEARTLPQKAPDIATYLFEGMDMERLAAILKANESALVLEFEMWSGYGNAVDRDWLLARGH